MKRHVLYVTNYYEKDVIEQRNSENYISQAGQNKSSYIIDMLEQGHNKVTVWSNAWTNSRSFRFYKGFRSKIRSQVYYSSIFGAPILNALSCYYSSRRFLDGLIKRDRPDVLVFYNMRLETSKLALYAKKKYKIPIVLQYEDGLTTDAHVSFLKRLVYGNMERKVLNNLDGAFLVNSKIEVPCPSVVIRGALRENMHQKDNVGVRKEKPTFLFASTLDKQRGIEVLLDALKETKEDFCLKITGRGEAEDKILLCKDERVEFLGYLDYETYQRELQNADICINAQLAHHEFGNFSFPSKIFEYLSAGKMVVSSDVADTKEALSNVLLIYEEDSPKQLAKAMERAIQIYKDDKLYEKYQSKIAETIAENSMVNVSKQVNQMFDTMR